MSVVAEPTCYRHRDRVTYVRCTRCDRPICPECMIPASVGFQCPDDVKAGAKGVRQPRTPFGGRAVSGDPAYITKALIALNVVLLLVSMSDSSFAPRFWMTAGAGGLGDGITGGEWYRLVTAAFLHENLLHLLFNMYALWLFGPPLEAAFGRVRFLAVYLVGAVTGVAASYAFSPLYGASLGASGAVFALFAAHLVVNRRLGRDSGGLWGLLAINVVLGFVVANVDWHAHAGGFVGGGLAAAVLVYAPAARRGVTQAVGLAAVVVIALGLTTWRSVDAFGTIGVDASAVAVLRCEVAHPLGGDPYYACVTPRVNTA